MPTFKRINVDTANAMINSNKSFILVDIRDVASYMREHIKGAINLNDKNINNFICNTPKDSSILVYCYHGNSSQRAANFLCESGFVDVYSLDGGYEDWIIKEK